MYTKFKQVIIIKANYDLQLIHNTRIIKGNAIMDSGVNASLSEIIDLYAFYPGDKISILVIPLL